jgi:predicted transcriptional regulator
MVTLIIDGELEQRLEALGATTEPVKLQFAREAIVEAVHRTEEQAAEAARWTRVEAEIESAFSGPTTELTDEVWKEISTAQGDPTPGSFAVP